MSFDLIIANPPFGNKGTIAADILNKTTDLGKECVFLTPKTSFRYVGKTTFEKYGSFSNFFRGESFFEGARFTSKLVISHKSNQTKNPFKDYEDFASSQCKLYKSYRSFQLKNETDIKEIRLTFSTWHFTDEQVKDFTKNLPRERIFVATHRNVSEGVHIKEKSFDIQYNLKGADFRKQTDCIAYEFKTKEERDNFTNWYYSTGKSGLAEYLSRLVSYGGIVLHIWFPHIDWSYERTDENIISELKEKEVFPKNWNFDDFQEDNKWTLMTKDSSGNVFSIDVTFNEIKSLFHSLNLKDRLKLLFSKKRSAPKQAYHFLNEIWAAKRALADAEEHLNKKLSSISPQDGADASEVFSQTDDRQKFERLFGGCGGLKVEIDQLISLYNSLTGKGKKELNSYLESK